MLFVNQKSSISQSELDTFPMGINPPASVCSDSCGPIKLRTLPPGTLAPGWALEAKRRLIKVTKRVKQN